MGEFKGRSALADFHDQKSGGFDPATGRIFEPGSPEYDRTLKELYITEGEQVVRDIRALIQQIDAVVLIKAVKKNPEQQRLLAEQKQRAKELISKVFSDVQEYMQSIARLQHARQREDQTQEDYLKENTQADTARTQKHNAMMASINAAVRFISYTFGQIDDQALEQWEEDQTTRGKTIARVQRVKLPNNVLLPDSVDLKNRTQTGEWALRAYQALSQLRESIK
ncbi:hypothetical protein HY933_00015 [Candidatus Falkowbacteria bacterium]|nr:hypothetical protein [Candidatus Falkowbacteria bacterium]